MAGEERWSGRAEFIMAAVGSAIGLGNIWRFPYICYKNGGGAFLIPYFVALFAAGIPLLIMKFALGQSTGYGAPKALGHYNKNWKWLGWMAILVGFGIVAYYGVVMGWSFLYLYKSFSLAWGSEADGISKYFFDDILQLKMPGEPGSFSIVWPIFIGLVLTWIAIYFCIWKGTKTVGRIIWITVPLPLFLLIVIIIRGITLPGAVDGLLVYLTPDLDALKNPGVWLDAFGQIFYSLSLGFGIMIAYSAYNPKDSDINNNAFSTGFWNCLFSYLAGFAVFSVLGFLATTLDKEVAEVAAKGPGLAFVVFPTILSKLPFGNVIFSVLFFVMLLTLGIDSAFSLVEAISKAFHDYFLNVRKEIMALIVCSVCFIAGIIFTTRAGLIFLDITDHYFNMGLVIVCFLECILIGWIVGTGKLRDYANSVSDFVVGKWWDFAIMFVVPTILGILLATNIFTDIKVPYEGYSMVWLISLGILPILSTFVIGTLLSQNYKLLGTMVALAGIAALMYRFLPLSYEASTILLLVTTLFGYGITTTIILAVRADRRKKAKKEDNPEE